MPSKPHKPTYTIILEAQDQNVPVDVRLRRLLKFAKRGLGLICVSCLDITGKPVNRRAAKKAEKPFDNSQGGPLPKLKIWF